MYCPNCQAKDTRVTDSRLADSGDAVRRRRECESCGGRFTTYERYEQKSLTVRKADDTRQPFDREKLLRGLVRATNKRPVNDRQLDRLVQSIEDDLRSSGGELSTSEIGELALRGLRKFDQVAYVRFASVYRDFDDVADFAEELQRLNAEPEVEKSKRKTRVSGG